MNKLKTAFKNFYRKLVFELSAADSFIFLSFYKHFYKPAKGSLSYFLDEYSRSVKDFTVLQIGANDGITNDPIHKFIKRDNWSGVLLEPQRYVYEQFLKKIYRGQKGIHTVNAAFGREDGVLPLYKIGFSNARWATGLASFSKAVVEDAYTSGHVYRRAAKDGIAVPEDPAQRIVSENVPVLCTATILQRYPMKKIDLLQIDAEGFDHEIIKMFDFSLVKPGAVIFEHSHIPAEDLKECIQKLSSLGYKLHEYEGNTVAVL